ncbi:3-oxoacyl-[acyl-carrier-protein] synthase II [Strigomonas culicis]|uniref:beta-ketoacyl-[acyl-carrier-protein] synthase I n=1 Tax=Strigomonas culicis TaxID=28005 RepID=S9UIA9_9TRYP|nr:beta-ketoacyl-acyl-carrier-protein synthase I [Strigomonas culicis]EPY28479.1 3-oxoacyl-[acyl-carrier-protein] synthase II [Strigomonas culicis]|eukprot:EPY28479.1 3-oxoacyl-[acyl-carrier-protein] synthase II [Strigomonas culicis]
MSFGAFPPEVRRRVVVTGLGLVTPLGTTTAATWAALCAGQVATARLEAAPYLLPRAIADDRKLPAAEKERRRRQLIDALPCQVAAVVPAGEGTAAAFAPTPHAPRSFAFVQQAVREALADARLLAADAAAGTPLRGVACMDRVGVNVGMGIPSLDDVADVTLHLLQDPQHVHYAKIHPFFVPKILGNMAAGVTAIAHGCTGPVGSSVAACATGAYCIGEAAQWVRRAQADVVLCGATESCVNGIALGGFARMRALCTKFNDEPQAASRPFDEQRGGFIMGEGAGIFVVEELEHALRRGAPIYAELRGFGMSCDAHHVAAPHPEGRGAQHCVAAALRDGHNVPAGAVGYVNAHATGTIGDVIELQALERALGTAGRAAPLAISSSKGALGHLLGAAGSVEAAVAVLALRDQRAPPTANLTAPCLPPAVQKEKGLYLVPDGEVLPLDTAAVVSTSFGFGGVNTSLLFTKL